MARASIAAFLVVGLAAVAQEPAVRAQATTPTLDPGILAGLSWRSIGPANTGGRIDDFAVARVPGAPDAIYVATASGGLWKSTNQGTSWTPVFDGVDAMMSIGDVTVAPSNPNVVWVGTGEANNRQSSSWGDGVYKSVDGGRTWQHVGLADTKHIARILIDPRDPDVVYVAAVGHLWGPNAERGVFKTTDGGRTWRKALAVDDNTGATDLVMDPQDPQTIFAAMYQRQRKAWGFNGGGPGGGIYRTHDGGETWTKLANGLPKGDKGRIGLAVFAGDGRIVYATVEAKGVESGVYRSLDRGDTWEQINTLNPRPMYYSQIRIDPKDRDRIYLLGSNRGFYISDDGGRNFRDVFSTVHSEDHALWIDPRDPNHLIVGGDGGVSISWDRGATWMFRDNLPIGQFYEISADLQEPYVVCGGLQDNGMWCVPSATRNRNGISHADAYNIGGGDGFYARIDTADPQTVYIDSQEGRSSRVDLRTLERQVIAPAPAVRPAKNERERWSWDTPVVVSSFDPKVIYTGSNVLFRSADRGLTWKAISPDLTANIDRDSLQMMGGRVPPDALSRHDGQASYGTITTIAESPLDARVLYVGSDDGELQATRDGGARWTDLTSKVPGLPPRTYVSSVLASRHAAGRVYATFDGHYDDDYEPYVFVSEDYGQTWRSISAGLPTSVHRIREHPRNPKLLFVGHERGLAVSIDGGATWMPLGLNMPAVPVDDLLIHPRDNDLVAGTHGRSLWILDDIGALEALTPELLKQPAALLPVRPARLLTMHTPQAWYGAGQFFAPNPPFGASITYYLREAATHPVRIVVADAGGAVVRTLEGPGRKGLNRAVWDLRLAPVDAGAPPTGNGGPAGQPPGPMVLPGTYRLTVTAGAQELRGSIRVEGDPLVTFSDADRRTRQAALLDLYELQRSSMRGRDAARRASAVLAAVRKEVDDGVAAGLADRLASLERDLGRESGRAGGLSRAIEGYSGVPTADQQRQIDWAFADVTETIRDLDRLLQSDMPALYSDLMQKHEWPPRVQPIPLPVRRP
ncbi:MAG: WD40/YVTN/BNR-like repeat-containing protein [Betaproteobacteria bacterium]